MPEWLKGADCKSVADGYTGSNPVPPTIRPRGAGVAHLFGKEEVTGPNPVVGSTFVPTSEFVSGLDLIHSRHSPDFGGKQSEATGS